MMKIGRQPVDLRTNKLKTWRGRLGYNDLAARKQANIAVCRISITRICSGFLKHGDLALDKLHRHFLNLIQLRGNHLFYFCSGCRV